MTERMQTFLKSITLPGKDGLVRLTETPEKDGLMVECTSGGRSVTVEIDCWTAYTLIGRYDDRVRSVAYELDVVIPPKPPEPEEMELSADEESLAEAEEVPFA